MVDASSASRRVLEVVPNVGMSAALMAATILVIGGRPALVPALYLAGVTPPLWRIDVASHRLPDRLVLPGYLAALVALLAEFVLAGELPLGAIGSGIGYLTFMALLCVPGGIGMGDVKLAGVLGLALGMMSLEAALLGPILGFLFGGLAGIGLMLARKAGTHSRIPFGPFMLAGFWTAALSTSTLGQVLATW